MKKGLAILLVFAVIFAFAACTKDPGAQGEIYVEPPTEIISFENGSTAVYEVVTDAKGEAVTDEDGEAEVIPYDPPVTEKGGYLATDPAGSTIKQSATTVAPSVAIDHDIIDFDETTASTDITSGNTSATLKEETTADIPTVSQPAFTTQSSLTPEKTTKPSQSATTKPTAGEITTIYIPEPETHAFNGEISKQDAQKLLSIVSIDNRFDAALCDSDFTRAAQELPIYIKDIEEAITKIKADKALYKYVGDENLNIWLSYMKLAEEDFAVFLGVYNGMDKTQKPPRAFYATYEAFQNNYRMSLQTYYHIENGAQAIIYS